MPSRRRGGDLVLFNSRDPEPLVRWLVETHGLRHVLRLLSEHQPGGAPTSTKRASKKGGKRGRPKGSKNSGKKGGKRGRKAQGGAEVGRG